MQWKIPNSSSSVIGRYVVNEDLEKAIGTLKESFKVEELGKSVEQRSIKSITWGVGKIKVLMWSQMHGNESTTTKAVLDLLKYLSEGMEVNDASVTYWHELFTIKIVPILNPDGAFYYTRYNANQVDLNRDAVALTQPESVLLRKVFDEFSPSYAFNLHDQRTIFGVGETASPATVSFLAPSFDPSCSWSATRKQAMQVIVAMNKALQQVIPGQIGRFDDAFNINCIGDYFQSRGVPTILIEAGHAPFDYRREKTSVYIYISLLTALHTIGVGALKGFTLEEYLAIPENAKNFSDIHLLKVRKAKKEDYYCVKVQFLEVLEKNEVIFVPIIADIAKEPTGYSHLAVADVFVFAFDWNRKEEIIGGNLYEIINISAEEVNSLLKNNVF